MMRKSRFDRAISMAPTLGRCAHAAGYLIQGIAYLIEAIGGLFSR